MGFLGGLIFTSLIVVLQAKSIFDVSVVGLGDGYFPFLVFSLALTSIVSIVMALSNLLGSATSVSKRPLSEFIVFSGFDVFSIMGVLFTAIMLAYIVPLLLLPFVQWEDAVVLFGVNVALLVVMLYLLSKR